MDELMKSLKIPFVYPISVKTYDASEGVSAIINKGVSVIIISHRFHKRTELAPGQH